MRDRAVRQGKMVDVIRFRPVKMVKPEPTEYNGPLRFMHVAADARTAGMVPRDVTASVKINAASDGSFEYSTDGSTWTAYVNGTAISMPEIGDCVYLRAVNTNDSIYWEDWYLEPIFTITGSVSAKGNINSLYDKNMTSAIHSFKYMFKDCTGLTTVPELPATTLADECYNSMFEGCTGLTEAPSLPATTLANYCYYGMFQGCTNVTSVHMKTTMSGTYNASTHGTLKPGLTPTFDLP